MDQRMVSLALRKQQLQLRAGTQRAELMHRLGGVDRVLDLADRVRDQVRWVKNNVPVLSAGLLLLVAAKPRLALRVAKRGFFALMLYRKVRGRSPAWLTPTVAGALAAVLGRVRRGLERAEARRSAPPRPRRTG